MKNKISILFLLFVAIFTLSACQEPQCIHSYTSEVVAATCIEDGYTIYTCSLCGDSYKGDIVRAEGHNVVVTKEGYPATCEESGFTNEEKCTKCNTITKQQVKISALGHKYDEWKEVTKPTADSTGLIKKICRNDNSHVKEMVLPVLSTSSTEYIITVKDATCTEEGLETYIIKVEDQEFVYSRTIEKIPHVYVDKVIEPDCLNGGYTTHTCFCGHSYTDAYTDALGHTYVDEVIEPTCTTEGYTEHKCECGDTYKDTYVDMIPHTYVDTVVAATCTEKGYTEHKCECGDTYIDTYVDMIPHTYVDTVVAATCTTEGYTEHKCECGDTYKDTYVDMIPHTYVDTVVAATCTEKGYTEHKCECGDTYIDTYVDMIPHTYVDTVVAATCTTEGYTEHKCECGDTYKDTYVDMIPHTYVDTVVAATCTEKGYTEHKCECGDTYIDTYVDEIPHTYVEEVFEPSCTQGGYTKYLCECGDTYEGNYTEKIPHSYTIRVVDPTCTEKGYVNHVCECGDSYQDSYILELGHKYGEWVVAVEPTLSSEGKLIRTCLNDSNHTEEYKLKALNNKDYAHVRVDAKCEVDGKDTYSITVGEQFFNFEIVIPKTEHLFVSQVTEPTCFEGGFTTYTCHCGNSFVDKYVDALGHNSVVTIEYCAPTCKEDGYTEQIGCSRCGKVDVPSTPIAALGHECKNNDGFCDRCGVIYGKDIIYINTYEEFIAIANDLNGRYQLTADIDLTNKSFKGFGNADTPFTGYFYGDDFSIMGLNLTNQNGALFYKNNGTIDSVVIDGANLRNYNSSCEMAAIACVNNGTIKNCEIKGLLKITYHIYHRDETKYKAPSLDELTKSSYDGGTYEYSGVFGGFAATNNNTIENCKFTGSIDATFMNECEYSLDHAFGYLTVSTDNMDTIMHAYLGAISGKNTGTISNCHVSGNIVSTFEVSAKILMKYGLARATTYAYAAAFVGTNTGTIANCSTNKAVINSELGATSKLPSADNLKYGYICSLVQTQDSVYNGVLAKNSGTVANIIIN